MANNLTLPFDSLKTVSRSALSVQQHVASLRAGEGMSPTQFAESLDRINQYLDAHNRELDALTNLLLGFQITTGAGATVTQAGTQVTITVP